MVRLRHRYLVAEYTTDGKERAADTTLVRSSSLLISLNNAIRQLHGIQGVALTKAGLLVKYVNNSTNMLVIRMRRSASEIVSSSLPYVRQVDGRAITLNTLYTGATIRHCNLFLVKYQRRKLEQRYGSLTSDLQRKLFEQELGKLKQFSVEIGPNEMK